MKPKFSLSLPFFPGFYETSLMNCDTDYFAIHEELDYYYHTEDGGNRMELTADDLDFDYAEYQKDVIDAFIAAWKSHAPEIVEDVEFDAIDSPRYYNFENDRLFCFVTLKKGWQDEMRHFIALNYDWLQERIHKEWSSRDGFISFMDNDIDGWGEKLFDECDTRYIGTMIGYMMIIENEDIYDDIISDTLENIYPCQYVFVIADREQEEAKQNATNDAQGMTPALA